MGGTIECLSCKIFIFPPETTYNEVGSIKLQLPVKLLPSVLVPNGYEVHDEPVGAEDVQFWQYPCETEKHAFLNHSQIPAGSNLDRSKKIIHQYIGLPWATYIDKNFIPKQTIVLYRRLFDTSVRTAQQFGYQLRLHSVCQHIQWRKLMPAFEFLGITDLHLSHCEKITASELDYGYPGIEVHPWPLIAVNVVSKDRNSGLTIGKPVEERNHLASFIGAHMDHYRSNVRIRISNDAQKLNLPDVVIDLGNEWHFNNIVYKEQVFNQELSQQEVADEISATYRYNQLLSDSKFVLCPEGAGPNSLRLWEAIATGCIPVLFDRELLFPDEVADELSKLCVFWESELIGAEFYDMLRKIPTDELQRNSNALISLYRQVENLVCF